MFSATRPFRTKQLSAANSSVLTLAAAAAAVLTAEQNRGDVMI